VASPGRPRRAWGWHPLTDTWAARIVADADIRPGDLVVDIGAGHGALTRHLVASGAHVIAVELHPDRVHHLRQRFATDTVTVVHADAAALRLPRRPFRVVASPPYAITSTVLRILLAPGSRIVAADLVLQKAVVRRYLEARAPGANRWLRHWTLHEGRSLPRRAFSPPPHVDSAVLAIRRR
jgi:23S rRNA (adenine-N6)-dimethyltransferase